MDLVIKNKVIITPMDVILKTLKSELTNGKLRDINKSNNQNIVVTCPMHKSGFERHPSCQVFSDPDDEYTEYGKVHCFTCGYVASLPQFVSDCFDESDIQFGEEWLLERFETAFISQVRYLPEIKIDNKPSKVKSLISEVDLTQYNYYHEYMWKRKLTKEIVDRFEVGYDIKQNMLIFPVRDDKGNLLFVTGRSVSTKRFMIPENIEKPVYLLYYIKQNNIQRVAVCESQINCLYMWSLGIPSVALFGTGTPYQYNLLNKSGIRVFDLYLDGDEAGRKGIQRFKQNIRSDVIVNVHQLPDFKDVNDLSLEEINNLVVL